MRYTWEITNLKELAKRVDPWFRMDHGHVIAATWWPINRVLLIVEYDEKKSEIDE